MQLGVNIFVLALSAGVAYGTAVPTRVEKHSHPYRDHWKRSVVGKRAVASVATGAAIRQLRGHPKNYGGGAVGFAKRAGAGFATHAVGSTVEHLVAARLHEDLQYHRSQKRGFGPRLAHALTSTVVTRHAPDGRRGAAVGRLSGHAAAGAFSQAALHAGSGAATAGVGLAAVAGTNVAREFWPRRARHGRRRM